VVALLDALFLRSSSATAEVEPAATVLPATPDDVELTPAAVAGWSLSNEMPE